MESKTNTSLHSIADKLVAETKKIMKSAKTEEDPRVRFERVLGLLTRGFR